MDTSISRGGGKNRAGEQAAERGFSLIEVMVSMVVLTVGLVTLLGVFGLAMASTQTSQQDMIAMQLANESLESIVTARNTSQISWVQIQNVSNGGIFMDGFNPINLAGGDGIVGTADDTVAGPQVLQAPGPDGIYGTSDDVQISLSGYKRKIEILPVTDASGNVVSTLRGLNITVQYSTTQAQMPKTYVLSSFISQYR